MKKIFHLGIDSSILNSKILFDKNYTTKIEVYKFKKNLYFNIFEKYSKYENNNNNCNNNAVNNYILKIYRNSLHSIGHIPYIKKRWKLCSNKTPYFCKECSLYMHPENFHEFHK